MAEWSVMLVSFCCVGVNSAKPESDIATWIEGVQLMKLTGGKFVATTHRVNTLKIDKDRHVLLVNFCAEAESQRSIDQIHNSLCFVDQA